MKLSPGAIVRCGSFADSVWVIRAQAGRPGYWHLQNKIIDRATPVTRVARVSELHLIAPAPIFKNGETVRFEGREATVIQDNGDEVAIVVGVSRHDVSKSELVLSKL